MLTRLKQTSLGKLGSRLYQLSGLKARIVARSIVPPVATIAREAFLGRYNATSVANKSAQIPLFTLPKIDSGPMPPADMEALASMVLHLSPRRIFEFGTNWGCTSAILLVNTPATTRIWTLDLSVEQIQKAVGYAEGETNMVLPQEKIGWAYRQIKDSSNRIVQIFKDSLLLSWSEVAFPENFDFIFIDACHAYEYIKSDTSKAMEKLAPGGHLVWHDFDPTVKVWSDVFKFVSEFARDQRGVFHIEGTHLAVWRKPLG